jgi:pimeloyl-ACP methyl ester carboxylesterase
MMRSLLLRFLFILFAAVSFAAQAQSPDSSCLPQNKSLPIRESSIKYFTMGSGQPVLLLHGLFAQKEQWIDFACQLSKGGYLVYAPDLPGYGQSLGYPISSYQPSKEADLIHDFTQNLGLSSFHLAGNSMGGAIAALYAQKYSKDVKSIAFIGAPMGIVSWSPQIRNAIYQGINPFIPITTEQFDLEMSLLFTHPPAMDDSIKGDAISEYIKSNRHYQQVWDIANLDIAVLDQSPLSQKPVLITWGKFDGVFDVSGRPLLDKRFPNHVSLEIPDAAHLIMLEKPKEIADLYINFMRSQM